MKIRAVSKDRYRASAAERRRYGGNTITEFWVTRDDTGETLVFKGYGPTPGERKTFALERAKQHWWPPVVTPIPATFQVKNTGGCHGR